MRYWLFKSEPTCFSFDDLLANPDQTTHWDGVRNYQARNFLRDEIKQGDLGIYYHSNIAEPHAIGTVEITRAGYPDFTAWDSASDHYDPASTPAKSRWYMVDVKARHKFGRPVTLAEMKQFVELAEMDLLKRGSRLSVMPLAEKEFAFLCQLGGCA